MKERNGNMLLSDVVFLVLAVSFFTILVVFIAKQSSSFLTTEEQSAKEIALMLDAMSPGTQASLFVKDVIEKRAEGYNRPVVIISRESHSVRVQLSEKSGYSYGFHVLFDHRYIHDSFNLHSFRSPSTVVFRVSSFVAKRFLRQVRPEILGLCPRAIAASLSRPEILDFLVVCGMGMDSY